jgi:hypothetical protein
MSSKTLYEGNVGSYSFLMVDENTIEVWSDMSSEHPESYIFLKDGDVKNEKSFHYEISSWYIKNVGN